MPLPNGAHYTDPTRHRVRLSGGETVSRTTAENLFAQSHGFSNDKAYRRARASGGFKNFQNRPGYQTAGKEAKAAGVSSKDFNAAAARYYANENVNRNDNTPDGPKAKMLEAMGRRSPGSEYNVGDSPTIY